MNQHNPKNKECRQGEQANNFYGVYPCTCLDTPLVKEEWEKMIEELRDEFEDLFPKDIEAIQGIRPSKSNRSSGLVLWGKWHLILKFALTKAREEERKNLTLNIGMLRQWLNERPAGSRLLTNQDIIYWLELK